LLLRGSTILPILMLLGGMLLAGCGTETVEAKSPPAVIEPTEQEGINKVTLTEKAAERLDIQTAAVVEEQIDGVTKLVVPYSAVIYDLTGATWIYVSPAALTFVREPITVETVDGDRAILGEGPAAGTEIAVVGVAELYGADTGVGK
jgi:hypothetical protein